MTLRADSHSNAYVKRYGENDMATSFEYLLNAMENAASHDNPSEHGYAKKRTAVLEYVEKLETLLREIQVRGLCFEDAELSQRVALVLNASAADVRSRKARR